MDKSAPARTQAANDSWQPTTDSVFPVAARPKLAPLPETRGHSVIILAPAEVAERLPEGFSEIDDLVAAEERDPGIASAVADGRRLVAEAFYAAPTQPLSYYRLRKGWSQKQLAERASTSQSYIARLESGGVDPQVSTLRRLAEVLGMPAAELLNALPDRK
jgi:DNA-binding XRE family transcriptional regulator